VNALDTSSASSPADPAPGASGGPTNTVAPDDSQPVPSGADTLPPQSGTVPAVTTPDPEASGVSEGEGSTPDVPADTSEPEPSGAAGSGNAGGAGNGPIEEGEGGAVNDTSAGGAEGEPPTEDGGTTEPVVTPPNPDLEPFSFFVTGLESMRALSQNDNGFGGDLRYGEADGLSGADKICAEIAELSMPGAASKQWRAFMSTAAGGPDGGPVHAIERIGEGPWYDRLGRLVAEDLEGLLGERPAGDAEVVDDLPNELGEPNSFAGGVEMDNHDTLTASDETGHYDEGGTCDDWTSTTSTESPMAGHSWPARSGQHWITAHGVAGCAPSVVDGQGSFGMGEEGGGVGDGGGYGGIYCFALNP
jgi:hypothetical protein